MKKILLILLTLSLPVLLLADEPVREWKNKSGKTIIEASLDSTKANDDPEQVYFLKEGERFKYPFEKLSAADQEYVTKVRQGKRSVGADAGQNGVSRSMQVVPKTRRYALLIGVNEYAKPIESLKFCVNDMKLLAESFEKIGVPKENIILVTDDSPAERRPTGENIRRQIETITQLMGQNDQLTIAFSGHGVLVNGKSCLCPSDTNLDNINSVISRDWAFAQLEKCKAKQKIFIIDACRDEVSLGDQRALGGTKTLKDPVGADTHGFILIASCDKKQTSWEHEKIKHGVFTYFLAEGLAGAARDEDGYVSIMNLFQYASSKTKKYVYRELNKAQVPTIGLRDEMTDFVIAKLDPTGLEVALPQNVEDVIIREYQVGSLKIKLQSACSTLSGDKIQAGKIQLPPIPKKIRELTGEVRGIQDALTRMENGTHEALHEAQQAKAAAQAQYNSIKLRRDEEWKQLFPAERNSLEQRIKESPTAEPTSFKSLRPQNIGFSQFIKLVLWGQKTELARLEWVRVESALKTEIQKEINRIKTTLADKTGELDLETRKFRQALVQFLLEQTPGWNKPNEDEKMDYMFLSETIPALLKYPFGWEEEKLFSIAEALWKERRPCVKERIKLENEDALKRLSVPGIKAGERIAIDINGVKFAFRWCPPGRFTMGSPIGEPGKKELSKAFDLDFDEIEKQHMVRITKGFWMMETEVTLGMFKAFVSETGYVSKGSAPYGVAGNKPVQDSKYSWRNPGFSQDENHPVTCVSWDDAVAFCKWLSKKTGQKITLPTEAQWEYACRAGSTTALPNGPIVIKGLNNAPALDPIAWYLGNSSQGFRGHSGVDSRVFVKTQYPGGPCGTHPVGKKNPNNWGLYDMIGNVWEWCADWYGNYPSDSVTTDPTGPSSGFFRVRRGGSWHCSAGFCRSANRRSNTPERRGYNLGFRCVKGQ